MKQRASLGSAVGGHLPHRCIAALLVSSVVAAASIAAGLPALLAGTYTRKSATCGGPGSADDPAKMRCDLMFEDKLSITAAAGGAQVSFAFHFGYGDYCHFGGTGSWSEGRLHLHSPITVENSTCHLSLVPEGSAVRVSDAKGACRSSLCTAPGPSLDGITFERAK